MLANRNTYNTLDWIEASKRFHQLYWADLPYYGEPQPVIDAMVEFKERLDEIDEDSGIEKWKVMDDALLRLSETLRNEAKELKKNIRH